ncbi:Gfo/Idh/MocA family oxidoreductase [uncultured Parasphingorhabdus sp.]|uniref:Gfo/Idh/MocA family oxidoreductase n=1 Tax=uncultured Parasphingorhabdus sp. TaxID=2709694 RepID=UPI0030D776DC|tara:strand:- start:59899 stop:61041 length:1143 start_codon:yes stop_codon:yes gene_type:complete
MTLRLAILGLGRGAVLTVPAFVAHPRIELVAGCDPSAQARDGFGRNSFASAEELFADGGFDAVYIASPHEFHASHAIMAARAGKHVLVEKPMAVTLAEATSMVAAARDAGTILMVGPSHGFNPPVALAAEIVASGEVGAARMMHSSNFTDFLYRPRRPAELDTAQGGGVVLSQGTHQIDMVRRIADSPVTSVSAWTGGWDARATEGAFTALLNFENGAVANLTYSGYAHYDSDAVAGWIGELGQIKDPEAHGRARATLQAVDEQKAKAARTFAARHETPAPKHHQRFGSLIISCEKADLELTSQGVNIHSNTGMRSVAAPLPVAQRTNVADAFARAILDEETPLFDGSWGRDSLTVCQAILRSASEGRSVAPSELTPSDI